MFRMSNAGHRQLSRVRMYPWCSAQFLRAQEKETEFYSQVCVFITFHNNRLINYNPTLVVLEHNCGIKGVLRNDIPGCEMTSTSAMFKPMASYSSRESTTHDYGQWTDAKWHQQLATTSFEPWATRDHVDQAKVGETKLTFNYPSNELHQIARTVLKIRAQPQWIHTLSEEFHSHSVSQTAHRRKIKQFAHRCILAVLTLYSLYDFDFIWATRHCDTFTFCHGNGAKLARHIHNLYSF